MSKGAYIVVEGLEGSGKTTQFNRALEHLGAATVAVREPGGTPMGEAIRNVLKQHLQPHSALASLFLFMAARASLVDVTIRPARGAGKTVLSDRNWLSSYAYQGADGVPTEDISELAQRATHEFFEPDLLILLDIDPRMCIERLRARAGDEADRFDYFGDDALHAFQKARKLYLEGAKKLKHTAIIDAARPVDAVWHDVRSALERLEE